MAIMMRTTKVSLGFLNREIGDRTMDQARKLVSSGEAKWVQAPFRTLKLVSLGYELGESEHFIVEVAPNHFVPAGWV